MKLKRITRLCNNKRGGIEGLPLQLMIIILVAALGTAVIVGWMGSIETPKSIKTVESDPGSIQLNGTTFDITIFVTDQNGDPLSDATVVLTGYGITDKDGRTPNAVTDAKGIATFTGLSIKNIGSVGFINAEAIKTGYTGKTVQIVVIR